MYTNYVRDKNIVKARDVDNKVVTIEVSISKVFNRVVDPVTGGVHYKALGFEDTEILASLKKLFNGQLPIEEMHTIETVHLRAGWLNDGLTQLSWMPILTVFDGFSRGTLETKQNSKLTQLCQLLGMSRRSLVKREIWVDAYGRITEAPPEPEPVRSQPLSEAEVIAAKELVTQELLVASEKLKETLIFDNELKQPMIDGVRQDSFDGMMTALKGNWKTLALRSKNGIANINRGAKDLSYSVAGMIDETGVMVSSMFTLLKTQ